MRQQRQRGPVEEAQSQTELIENPRPFDVAEALRTLSLKLESMRSQREVHPFILESYNRILAASSSPETRTSISQIESDIELLMVQIDRINEVNHQINASRNESEENEE